MTRKQIAEVLAEDDGVGGFHASYGVGIATTDWDWATFGVGRNAREAAEDAAESLAQTYDLDSFSDILLTEAVEKLSDNEGQVIAAEFEVIDEICKERFSKPYVSCTHDEQQAAQDDTAISDPVQHGAVLWIRWEK